MEEGYPTKIFNVFSKKQWVSAGYFTEEEVDNADENGFIGTRYGVDCYVNKLLNPKGNLTHL